MRRMVEAGQLGQAQSGPGGHQASYVWVEGVQGNIGLEMWKEI